MRQDSTWKSVGRPATVALALTAASCGGALGGTFDGCPTFDTCTAGFAGYVMANTAYIFSGIQPGYVLPPGLQPGSSNLVYDTRQSTTSAPLEADVGEVVCATTCGSHFFEGFARAVTQTDFGVNRALARTSFGGSGIDDQGGGRTAAVRLVNFGEALSTWRDVWTFSENGHASARISLDGRSGTEGDNAHFPVGFTHGPSTIGGTWEYDFTVWDLSHLVPDVEGFLIPTLVTQVSAEHSLDGAPFIVDLDLDFDFVAGDSYFITSRLDVTARDGGYVDLYNTVRLGDVALSDGATLEALSGHEYTVSAAPVPEPEAWMSMLAGGLAMLGICRRRGRAARDAR